LAGYWAQQRFDSATVSSDSIAFSIIVAIFLFTCVMGAVFLINQVKDIETDRLNNKLYLIASGDVPLCHAWVETVILFVLPTMVTVLWRWKLAVVTGLAFLILGWFYSCPPFSLKDRPVGGAITNLCGGYLVFCFGWMILGNPHLMMLLHATPYALGLLAVYFFTTLPDQEGDRTAKKITVAVRYGNRTVLVAGLIADCAAIILAAVVKDMVIFIPTVISFPFFIRAALTHRMADVLLTNKLATLFLSLAICIKFYLYLPLITVIFLFSKWYYKKRFNIRYPSFRT
jgi:4-hydroxybenzoate polyprenyltransferase